MSYDIRLKEPVSGKTIIFDKIHRRRGGTYASNCTTEAWLNVTGNYAPHYYRVFGAKGIRVIYGMTGDESIPVIKAAMDLLADNPTVDYWEPTEGNAKMALADLLAMAQMRPYGIWDGD